MQVAGAEAINMVWFFPKLENLEIFCIGTRVAGANINKIMARNTRGQKLPQNKERNSK